MSDPGTAERSGERAILPVAIVAAFVALRVVLLVVREPFYDELFTTWLEQRSLSGILDALRHDSGPPLYYFLLKITGAGSVIAARVVSLVCATLGVVILLAARRLGSTRLAAAFLLVFYAPSMLLSVDARAYALCSLFVTIGIVAVVYERPYLAACAFALAGYSHYYGVLFFATLPRWRAAALSALLFVPGFLLAYEQPVGAMHWLSSIRYNPLTNLSFAGLYPDALFEPSPRGLVILALVVLIAAVARDWRMARFTIIPIALAVILGFFGRPAYFPMRFESVIAVPLVVWIAASLQRWTPRIRAALVASLAIIGAFVCVSGIAEHARRPLDDYRLVALAAREKVPVSLPVVASGYLYLECVSALGNRVGAFPAEQAQHPGWRAVVPAARFVAETRVLPPHFVWIGERGAPELPVLCRAFECRPLFGNARALILDMRARGASIRTHD